MKKKLILTAMTIVMVFGLISLTGCNKDKNEEAAEQETSASESETAAESTEAETEEAFDADYSLGLTETGLLEGLTASDYVTVPDAELLTFNLADIELTDQEIDDLIDAMMADSFQEPSTEKEVEDGDTVNIDYVGSVDGVEFEGGNTKGNGTDVTIGVTSYIDDFLEQLIGHKPGETINVEVTFPDSYPQNTDLEGKDAVFVTTINHVKVTPELTDDFVKEHSEEICTYWTMEGVEDVEDLKAQVYDQSFEYNLGNAIYEKVYSEVKIDEIPEAAYEMAKNQISCQLYTTYGITWNDYVAQSGYTQEEIDEMLNENAKVGLIYQAIAEQEGIEITEDAITEYIGEDNAETMLGTYGRGYVAQRILYADAMKYLQGIAVVK